MNIQNNSELKQLILIWRKNPVIFAKNALGFIPDEWQSHALNDIRDNPQVAIASGQGVGKTSIEAVIILWFLVCFPNSKVICTAPTKQQLMDVLWAEVAKWLNDSIIKNILKWTKTKVSMVGEEDRWFATARTATKPENMQGFHEDNMIFVVDEASGIEDKILEAILGTLSGPNNKIVMMGNPTKTTGGFFDAFHKDKEDWKTRKVSSLDSSRTSKKNIERLIRKYGKDSDAVRVRVFGDFPAGSVDTLINIALIDRAIETEFKAETNQAINRHDTLDIGVDVARYGDDKTHIVPRIKGYYFDSEDHEKQSLMVTTGNIIDLMSRYLKTFKYIQTVYIKIDDTGLGGGVTDRLAEQKEMLEQRYGVKIHVIPVNNGERALEPEYFMNLGTQLWSDFRDLLNDNMSQFIQGKESLIKLPDDDVLKYQLQSRKYTFDSSGRIRLESKDKMKKRGLESPDYADAVILAMYRPPLAQVEVSDY